MIRKWPKIVSSCCGEGIGGKQFKAILNHFVVILGSFFGHFWGHFLDHFLEYVNNRFNRLKNVCIRSYKASWGLIRPYKVTLWTHLGLSWAVFGAILRNLIQSWAILGSCWDRFWAILNNFETILGTSSNFEKKCSRTLGQSDFSWVNGVFSIFWCLEGTTFGTHFGTPSWTQICPRRNKMSPRGPSEASKTKKLPFQNH